MAFSFVPFGLYEGYDRARVLTELAKVDAAIQDLAAGQGQIVAVAENGKNVQFAPTGGANADGMTRLQAQKLQLRQALALVDDSVPFIPSHQLATFQ